jgi:hypothetical protein
LVPKETKGLFAAHQVAAHNNTKYWKGYKNRLQYIELHSARVNKNWIHTEDCLIEEKYLNVYPEDPEKPRGK